MLLKPFGATYHESGKSYKQGFINLKLARVDASTKSSKRFKVEICFICVFLRIDGVLFPRSLRPWQLTL